MALGYSHYGPGDPQGRQLNTHPMRRAGSGRLAGVPSPEEEGGALGGSCTSGTPESAASLTMSIFRSARSAGFLMRLGVPGGGAARGAWETRQRS